MPEKQATTEIAEAAGNSLPGVHCSEETTLFAVASPMALIDLPGLLHLFDARI